MGHSSFKTLGAVGRHTGLLVLTLVAATVAVGVYAISSSLAAPAKSRAVSERLSAPRFQAPASKRSTPTARGFETILVETTAEYGRAHGKDARITNAHCVQGSPGHYMCSYAVDDATAAPECHLMQAIWTPKDESLYTVTLAGRVAACGTLREAVRSLP